MLGLGGGVFLVPLLTLALGVPIRAAVAASLVSVIATASASATVNLNRGLVNLRLGMVLEVATSVGGLTGGVLAAWLSHRQLFLTFGLTLIAMGIVTALRSGRRNVIADLSVDPGRLGGGIVKVPMLNTFCGIPFRVAAATSTFMIGVTAAASALPYFSRGDMVLPLAAAISLGALPGSLLGARLSERLQARWLKVLMAAVLVLVGARMGWQAR
jgi:uncharacterized membrane protein YfcA